MLVLKGLKYDTNDKRSRFYYDDVKLTNEWLVFTLDEVAVIHKSSDLVHVFDETGNVVPISLATIVCVTS